MGRRRANPGQGEIGGRNKLRLVVPPIYLLSIAVGLALLGLYIGLTADNLGHDIELRQFLTRTAYPAFLTGGKIVASGDGANLYNLTTQETVQQAILAPHNYPGGLLPYNHLPFLAVVMALLAVLPLETSYPIWAVATALAYIAALALLSTLILPVGRNRIEAHWATYAFWALGLGFFPTYQELTQSQTAAWMLLGYALALVLLGRGKLTGAGAAFASGLLKPQLLPVPLLVLLLTRRWRTLLAFAGVAVVLALLVTPLVGGPGWVFSYLNLLTGLVGGSGTGNIHPTQMESLRGLFTLLAVGTDPAGEKAGWILPAMALGAVVYLALLVWFWVKAQDHGPGLNSPSWLLRWAATLLSGLLISPHLIGYELVAWLLAGVLVWRAARLPGGPQPRQAGALLTTGYVMGTISLTVISVNLVPLHLGALFMVGAIPLLLVWSKRAETREAGAAA